MNIFADRNYRRILRKTVEAQKEKGMKKSFTHMATAIRVQKAYVSRVLKEMAHFNADQLCAAADYLDLNGEESHYLVTLMEWERASNLKRKESLENEIARVQGVKNQTEKRLNKPAAPASGMELVTEYYLDPNTVLIHFFLLIDSFRKDVEKIRTLLGMERNHFEQCLKRLERLEIIVFQNGNWRVLKEEIHIPKEHPLRLPFQSLMRVKVGEYLQRKRGDKFYNLQVTFTGDEATREAIQEKFFQFLEEAGKLVKAAPNRGVYQMAFDLFPWI